VAHRSFAAALGLGQLVSWGTLYYSFPLIAAAIVSDTGWRRVDIYGAATLGLLAATLMVFPVGVLIDRGHGRKVMVGATLAASLTLIAWSYVTTLAGLYAAIITLGVLQAALLYEPAFAITVRYLGAQKARAAITAITLWAGFSSTVFVPLMQLMLDALGWRGALLGLAIVNAVAAVPLYLWAIPPAGGARQSVRGETAMPQLHIASVLRSPRFYLLTASFCAYMALFSGFTYHIYPLMIALAAEPQSVVLAIALIGPAQVGARVLMLLFEEVTITRIGLLSSIAFPLAILLLWAPPEVFTLAVLCTIYGGANGVFTIVRGMAVPELLSRHSYGAINGIMLVPMSLARAAAPWAVAAYWTHCESPDAAIQVLLALAVMVPVLFVLALVVRPPQEV
jgi:MFS family permease